MQIIHMSQLIDTREMHLRETGCDDERWIELAQDRDQWRNLVLAVLNLCVLLSKC
jgi:hypothetical protein